MIFWSNVDLDLDLDLDTTRLSREGNSGVFPGEDVSPQSSANAHLHANVRVFKTQPPSSGIWDLFRAHSCWIRSVCCVHGLMRPTRTSQHNDLTRFSEDESHTKFLPLALPSMLPPGAVPDWAVTHPSAARAQRCLTSVRTGFTTG